MLRILLGVTVTFFVLVLVIFAVLVGIGMAFTSNNLGPSDSALSRAFVQTLENANGSAVRIADALPPDAEQICLLGGYDPEPREFLARRHPDKDIPLTDGYGFVKVVFSEELDYFPVFGGRFSRRMKGGCYSVNLCLYSHVERGLFWRKRSIVDEIGACSVAGQTPPTSSLRDLRSSD